MMHYIANEYSITGAPTIVPLTQGVQLGVSPLQMHQRLYPSDYDYFHVNLLYGQGTFKGTITVLIKVSL